ncbi:Fanconi-associated nuclease [Favolaschia claudopus]|uniref:Fanconi-associated nuclease n=1 Tax=Favolaschia claudopus TaxID=2862362 RepID=A0AAW0CF65_9AGAR
MAKAQSTINTCKPDIIFTGFLAPLTSTPARGESNAGETLTESELDLNARGDFYEPPKALKVLKTMITTTLETDAHLFTPAETHILNSILKLSGDSHHLITYLITYPHWHRLGRLQQLELPCNANLLRTIAELCRPIVYEDLPVLEPPQVKQEPLEGSVSARTAVIAKVEVQVKAEPHEPQIKVEVKAEPFEACLPQAGSSSSVSRALASSSLNTSMNNSDSSTTNTSNSTLFPSPRPNPHPTRLCTSDSDLELRELLGCLEKDELNGLCKQLKIKIKPGQKDSLIEAIIATSSHQRALTDFFGAKGSKGKDKEKEIETETAAPRRNSQEKRLREMVMKILRRLVKIDEEVHGILLRVHVAYFRSTTYPTEIIPRPLRHLSRKYPTYASVRTTSPWDDRETFIEYIDCLRAVVVILEGGVVQPVKSAKKVTGKRKRESEDSNTNTKREAQDAQTITSGTRSKRMDKARATKKLLDEEVYPRWAKYHALRAKNVDPPVKGMERFKSGSPLTHAVSSALKPLQDLKARDAELGLLGVLLDQKYWACGDVGWWYTRKAAILEERGKIQKAIEVASEALKDGETGLIYRHRLIASLSKMQKKVHVEDTVVISDGVKPGRVTVSVTPVATTNLEKQHPRWRTANGDVGTIEELAFQHYKADFGVHKARVTPGSPLLTTLFTLLFWDIIYKDLPGAFETEFQTCPLDLCEDTFFSARKEVIDQQLLKIRAKEARTILGLCGPEYWERRSTAVGVRWDLYSLGDLVGFIECIDPDTLAVICQMFCENYVAACRGVPDLIAWDLADKKCRLVHIQGPGWPARCSKKEWRDVLERSRKASQEVWEAIEPGKARKKEKKERKKKDDDDDSAESEDELESEDEEAEGSSQRSQSQVASGSRLHEDDEEKDEDYRPKKKRKKASG